jgi:acyl-CoA synthetase (AMP-forming)/AMP-acid ligase II
MDVVVQIEDLISQCEGVSEAAVIGVKNDKWGERPLALVIRNPRAGDTLSDREIKEHLKALADAGAISKYGIPDKVLFIDELLKTSVGKFARKQLREIRQPAAHAATAPGCGSVAQRGAANYRNPVACRGEGD